MPLGERAFRSASGAAPAPDGGEAAESSPRPILCQDRTCTKTELAPLPLRVPPGRNAQTLFIVRGLCASPAKAWRQSS